MGNASCLVLQKQLQWRRILKPGVGFTSGDSRFKAHLKACKKHHVRLPQAEQRFSPLSSTFAGGMPGQDSGDPLAHSIALLGT